ncbi:hypothetical protein B0H13DRAFT_1974476 [Mycena leptocephala]|nr:hypothetical protein B0H13DRAFT_1974476 [Mycena leptocephala]
MPDTRKKRTDLASFIFCCHARESPFSFKRGQAGTGEDPQLVFRGSSNAKLAKTGSESSCDLVSLEMMARSFWCPQSSSAASVCGRYTEHYNSLDKITKSRCVLSLFPFLFFFFSFQLQPFPAPWRFNSGSNYAPGFGLSLCRDTRPYYIALLILGSSTPAISRQPC